MSGALRFLHSPEGSTIADDPDANVVVILPDGIRNYMSKSWFLDVAADKASAALHKQIQGIIGRDLNDVGKVLKTAKANGFTLQNGEGLGHESKQ